MLPTHCDGNVCPGEGAFLGAGSFFIQHHGLVFLNNDHLPISQWGHQGLQLLPSGEEFLDGTTTINLGDRTHSTSGERKNVQRELGRFGTVKLIRTQFRRMENLRRSLNKTR